MFIFSFKRKKYPFRDLIVHIHFLLGDDDINLVFNIKTQSYVETQQTLVFCNFLRLHLDGSKGTKHFYIYECRRYG